MRVPVDINGKGGDLMSQADIERVRNEPPQVFEPDEIIDVTSGPVSAARPDAKVRTTELVARGLDLLTGVGRLILRFLQDRNSAVQAFPRVASSAPIERNFQDRVVDRDDHSRQRGRRQRRCRHGRRL